MRNGFCFLADRLPTTIGKLKLDTRASTAISIMLKLQSEATDAEKAMHTAIRLFGVNYSEAFKQSGFDTETKFDEAILQYLAGAPQVKSWKELHPDEDAGPSGPSLSKGVRKPDFDLVQDSGSIMSAFRQIYGLSLDEVCNLHWWEFLELLGNLPPEGSMFSLKRSIRNRKPDPKATPEQKTALREAKKSMALKDTRSPEKKAKDRQAMFDALEL